MPQAKRFIIRDRNNPDVYCEFFIAGSNKDNLAMLRNKGMEILVVSAAETEDIKGTSINCSLESNS